MKAIKGKLITKPIKAESTQKVGALEFLNQTNPGLEELEIILKSENEDPEWSELEPGQHVFVRAGMGIPYTDIDTSDVFRIIAPVDIIVIK